MGGREPEFTGECEDLGEQRGVRLGDGDTPEGVCRGRGIPPPGGAGGAGGQPSEPEDRPVLMRSITDVSARVVASPT